MFAGWWLQKAEKGNANKEFLCLPNFSEVCCLGHKENSDHPFKHQKKMFSNLQHLLYAFYLVELLEIFNTIDSVVGKLVSISTDKICNCNSYINGEVISTTPPPVGCYEICFGFISNIVIFSSLSVSDNQDEASMPFSFSPPSSPFYLIFFLYSYI